MKKKLNFIKLDQNYKDYIYRQPGLFRFSREPSSLWGIQDLLDSGRALRQLADRLPE